MNQIIAPIAKFSKQKYFIALFAVWVVYGVVSILAPTTVTANRYAISATQANLIRITILLPYLLIWGAGLFAVLRFRQYSSFVASAPEGKSFRHITNGLWMLFLVIIIPPFVSLVAAYNPDSALVQKVVTIIRNYITIALYLGAFWYLLTASHDLKEVVNVREHNRHISMVAMILIVVLAIAYCWTVFNNPFRTTSSDALIRPTYYLNDWLITLTVVIPYFLIWLWGASTVVNMRTLAKQMPGVVYRKAFLPIVQGLGITVTLLIGLQFLTQAGNYFGHAGLRVVLLIVYVLFIIIALGYLLVARGAKELTAIEEVE